MTANGPSLPTGTVLLSQGTIRYVGPALSTDKQRNKQQRFRLPNGDYFVADTVINANDKFVTPGIIDAHSHIGVFSIPYASANSDGNETSSFSTPQAKAEYGYWPQDPAIAYAQAAGVTTALVLPGSANLVGGSGFTVVMKTGLTTKDVAFPKAPPTIKMACGENPKSAHGQKGGPVTRMALYAKFRELFSNAKTYATKNKAEKTTKTQDAKMDSLASVLAGDTLVQIHCYRASDIAQMVAIASEFGFSIRAFHHASEAYKIRRQLIDAGIAIATWADWWGFKLEAWDGIPQNAGLYTQTGGKAVIHSDSNIGVQRLHLEAAKALFAANQKGIPITENQALQWITKNAAWVLGIDKVVGTIESGKRADVVIWSGHPFHTYTTVEKVMQSGVITYDKTKDIQTQSDFTIATEKSHQ